MEEQVEELERSFPGLRQKLDIQMTSLIIRLAPRFTGDGERDLALLRGVMENLYKPRDHDALWKRIEDEREYTLRVMEHARLYRYGMSESSLKQR